MEDPELYGAQVCGDVTSDDEHYWMPTWMGKWWQMTNCIHVCGISMMNELKMTQSTCFSFISMHLLPHAIILSKSTRADLLRPLCCNAGINNKLSSDSSTHLKLRHYVYRSLGEFSIHWNMFMCFVTAIVSYCIDRDQLLPPITLFMGYIGRLMKWLCSIKQKPVWP